MTPELYRALMNGTLPVPPFTGTKYFLVSFNLVTSGAYNNDIEAWIQTIDGTQTSLARSYSIGNRDLSSASYGAIATGSGIVKVVDGDERVMIQVQALGGGSPFVLNAPDLDSNSGSFVQIVELFSAIS